MNSIEDKLTRVRRSIEINEAALRSLILKYDNKKEHEEILNIQEFIAELWEKEYIYQKAVQFERLLHC